MATRSLTTVRSRWDATDEFEHNVTIYRHFDGYPSGHGNYLARFLNTVTVGNGRTGAEDEDFCNGPGELAAALVAFLRKEDCSPSLVMEGTIAGQEYHYVIEFPHWGDAPNEIEVVVFKGPMTFFGGGGEECTSELFRGTRADFLTWINNVSED